MEMPKKDEDEGRRGERDRSGQAFQDLIDDRFPRHVGESQIALRRGSEPIPELHEEGPVETELFRDGVDLGLRDHHVFRAGDELPRQIFRAQHGDGEHDEADPHQGDKGLQKVAA